MSHLSPLSALQATARHVLLRLDLNLPVYQGELLDDTRIIRSLPTLNVLYEKGVQTLIVSHFGRPGASANPKEWDLSSSLIHILPFLKERLPGDVVFCPAALGKERKEFLKAHTEPFILLENIRFYPGETVNDHDFSKDLAKGVDAYVNDAFSCSHRAHASVVGVTEWLPSYAGISLETEVNYLEKSLETPKKPTVAVVGGAKISTKLGLLDYFTQTFDKVIVGGGIAHTFLKAKGAEIGKSLVENTMLETAQSILEKSKSQVIVPIDAVIKDKQGAITTRDIKDIGADDIIFDVGPKTCQMYEDLLLKSPMGTLIWNGPLGFIEEPAFSKGSAALAHMAVQLTTKGTITLAGGGETVAVLKAANALDQLTFVSTAGGAFLEWLEGKPLPGVIALQKSSSSS